MVPFYVFANGRRKSGVVMLSSLLLLGGSAVAQSDLNMTSDGSVPAGTYRNITVNPGVNASISGAVTVTGRFYVDSAGSVSIGDAAYIDGQLFELEDEANVRLETAIGIGGGTTGGIRTVNKDFGTKGRFTFNNAQFAQIMGPEMADEVSELVVNNPFNVEMSKPLRIRERLHLRNGNLVTNGFMLTLISRTPDIAMVTAASAVVFNQGGVVIGNVTAERYINPRYNAGVGYRHFSSSVANTIIADFTTPGFRPIVNPRYNTVPYSQRFIAGNVVPYPNTFYYQESQVGTGGPGTYDEVFVQGYQSPNSLSDSIQVTRGYSVRIPASETVDFVGRLNNGPMNTGPLTRGALNESGWHLVGNPYPSKIDWALLTRQNMFNQFSKYRSTGPTEGVYDTYVNGTSTGPSGNQFIAANQAVFARVATPNSVGSVNFTNPARIVEFRNDPTAPFFRGTATTSPKPLTRLAIENANGLHDEAVVYFEQGATTGIDIDFDGFYINGGYPVGIYSQVGPEQLSINGLPELLSTTDYTVPFVVNTRTAGSYQINATEMANLPGGFQVLLQDAVTGLSHDLTLNPSYTFSSTGGNANNTRFTVRYRSAGVAGLSETIAASGFDVYPNPVAGSARLHLVLPGVEAGKTVGAAIYNDLGQRVWSKTYKTVLGGLREEISAGLARGIYSLQVALPDGSKQSRRVVVQ